MCSPGGWRGNLLNLRKVTAEPRNAVYLPWQSRIWTTLQERRGEELMFRFRIKKLAILVTGLVIAIATAMAPLPMTNAADHAEATLVAGDPGADLADVFAFIDPNDNRSEEHTSELQSRFDLVCRLLLEKKKKKYIK